MKEEKRRRLEEAGWTVGSAAEFLELSPEQETFVELKLALAGELRSLRKKKDMTQTDVAKLVESSQSRVAKMEAGDASVSVDLLIRSLLAMGVSRRELAKAISR